MAKPKAKILVIEADPFLSKLYRVKLKDLKYEVDIALNGEEGHRLLKMNSYDAVLMDLVLPYRDGFTLLKDMKRMRKRIKVRVVVSELQQEDDLKKAAKLGVDYYFIKNEHQTFEIIDNLKALLEGKKRMPHHSGFKMQKGKIKKMEKKAAKRKATAKRKTSAKKKTTSKKKFPSPKRKK